MKILHELNWLWEMLGIALAAAAVGLLLGETPELIAQGLVSYQAKEEAPQADRGNHRRSGICGCRFDHLSDCPNHHAALIRWAHEPPRLRAAPQKTQRR